MNPDWAIDEIEVEESGDSGWNVGLKDLRMRHLYVRNALPRASKKASFRRNCAIPDEAQGRETLRVGSFSNRISRRANVLLQEEDTREWEREILSIILNATSKAVLQFSHQRLQAPTRHWPKPCVNSFERLAAENPSNLISWIREGNLAFTDLTFAAEELGRSCEDSALVVPCLIELSMHIKPIVREGAVYGLSYHLKHPQAVKRLHGIAKDDPRPNLREAAQEALEDIESLED